MNHNRRLLVVGCVVALLAVMAISAFARSSGLRDWLDEHYTHVSGEDIEVEPIVYSSDDSQMDTAAAIIDGTQPDDRASGSSESGEPLVFLRYDDDWLVTVAEDGAGARIELFEFDEGYDRHGGFLLFWGGFYRSGGSPGGFFRGGGGGFGK